LADVADNPGGSEGRLKPLNELAPRPPVGRSLTAAVVTAVVLVGIVALCAYIGTGAFFVLVCVVVLLAQFELYDALHQTGHRPVTAFGLVCGLGMLVAAFVERPALMAAIVVVAAVGGFLLALRPTRGPTPSSDVAWLVLGVLWIGGGGAAATSILVVAEGIALLLAFVFTAALDDITAYFVGVRFGRHKMAPSISPAKSWEGFFGGMAGALIGGAVLGSIVDALGPLNGLLMGAAHRAGRGPDRVHGQAGDRDQRLGPAAPRARRFPGPPRRDHLLRPDRVRAHVPDRSVAGVSRVIHTVLNGYEPPRVRILV
jgi:phosphatidate cytidylyltransferase